MSFSSLPEELVDTIALFVGVEEYRRDDLGNVLTGNDFDSLLSLCLVSRKMLPSARRALYRSPFQFSPSTTLPWERAVALLATLRSTSFGHLVRDTFWLINWVCYLQATSWDPGSNKRTLQWYYNVLRACPYLQCVDIGFKTQDQLDSMFQILAHRSPSPTLQGGVSVLDGSLHRLRRLYFFHDIHGRPADRAVDFTDIFEILRRSPILSLDKVKFSQVECTRPFGLSPRPRFPLPVKSLYHLNETASFAALLPFFPEDTSGLEKFGFEGYTTTDGTELLPLPKLLGPNLKSLFLSFFDGEEALHLQVPGSVLGDPYIHLETFKHFPLLTILSLCGTRGPSLPLLETLLASSPLLSKVRFIDSHWICPSKPTSDASDELFPEAEILAVLLKLTRLDYIHLGTLPTSSKRKYRSLVDQLQIEGIAVRYEIREQEDSGSDEHSDEDAGERDSDNSDGEEES